MSTKYRCPACGATHKELVNQCRLCGRSLDPTKAGDSVVAPTARVVTSSGSSTKGFILIGIGAVLLIAIGGIVFGVIRSNKAIDTAVNKLPGIGAEQTDGWSAIPAEKATELGFTVSLPGDRTFETITFPGVDDNKLTGYSAAIGKDYEFFAGTATFPTPASLSTSTTEATSSTTNQDVLKSMAQLTCVEQTKTASGTTQCVRYKTGDGRSVQKITEIKAWPGLTAITVDAQAAPMNGKDAFSRTLYAMRPSPTDPGTTKLYVVQVRSLYQDAPALDKLITSFNPV